MPIMPVGVAIFAGLLIIPLVVTSAVTWLIFLIEHYQLALADLRTELIRINMMLSVAFILSIPMIIAFWTKHPHRWAISFLSLLTGWLVIPYLFAIHWSLSRGTKTNEAPLSTLTPPPIPPSLAMAQAPRDISGDFQSVKRYG